MGVAMGEEVTAAAVMAEVTVAAAMVAATVVAAMVAATVVAATAAATASKGRHQRVAKRRGRPCHAVGRNESESGGSSTTWASWHH